MWQVTITPYFGSPRKIPVVEGQVVQRIVDDIIGVSREGDAFKIHVGLCDGGDYTITAPNPGRIKVGDYVIEVEGLSL